MNFILNNWYLILSALAVAIMVIAFIFNFFRMPSDKQINNLKEWLKLAVTQAEKELGSKTGQLKLRYVYDLALARFNWLGKLISFEQFSLYVDEALIWLNEQLKSNEAVQNLVNKGE